MILVSRNIRYVRDIREGSLGRGVKRLWVVEELPIYLCPCIVERVFSVLVTDGFPLRHSQRPINVIYSSLGTQAGVHRPIETTREMSDVR